MSSITRHPGGPLGAWSRGLGGEVRALPGGAWVLAGGSFVNRFGSFVLPFLTLYLISRGYSPGQAGAAVVFYGVGKLAAAPAGGYLADRIGPRRSTALSMLASAVSMLALWRAGPFPAILALAGVTGLASELYRPSTTALLADIVDEERRVSAFGVYALGTNAGLALGPALGGVLAEHSFAALFVGDAVTSMVWACIALRALPETRRRVPPAKRGGSALRAIAHDRELIRLLACSTLANLLLFQAQTTLPLWIRQLGYSSAIYGALLAANGALNAMLQLPVSTVSKRFPARSVLAVGCALIGSGFAITGLFHSLFLLFAAVLIWTLGELINWPVGAAYLARLAPDGLAGRYAGARSFTYALGLVLAPVVGVPLLDWSPTALQIFCLTTGVIAAATVLSSGNCRTGRSR